MRGGGGGVDGPWERRWIGFSEDDLCSSPKAQDIRRQSHGWFNQRVDDNAFHLCAKVLLQMARPRVAFIASDPHLDTTR